MSLLIMHGVFAELKTDKNRLIGYEFVVPSISSPGIELFFENTPIRDSDFAETFYKDNFKDIKWINTKNRGWLLTEFNKSKVKANFYMIDDVRNKNYKIIGPKIIEINI